MIEVRFNPADYAHLYTEMQPRQRMQALKGAFRRTSTKLRRATVEQLRADGPRTNGRLEKCVRRVLLNAKRGSAGFKVTLMGVRGRTTGFYRNRRGQLKPVLVFAEDGTAPRNTRKGKRARHSTGRLRRYGFLDKATKQLGPSIGDDVKNELKEQIKRIAAKYGFT